MKAYEHSPVDRSKWALGPWWDEVDEHSWQIYGLNCWMLRNRLGAWCGYVGVEESHPIPQGFRHKEELSVHGGITYAQYNSENHLWWYGFDCAHAEDTCPTRNYSFLPGTYKDFNYVKSETENLALQLANMTPNISPYHYSLSREGYTKLQTFLKNSWFSEKEELEKIFAEHLKPYSDK